ncbi:MAG: GNAT family N-acetyltransferase [Actinobacteria bacterium]|nr:GNAT family N-acetyltransferase [Actinomycetota bacterium]
MVIARLSAEETARIRAELVKVYREAWSTTKYALTRHQIRDFASVFDMHLGRDDFRAVTARDDPDGPMLGFAYGYTSAPGGWWRETVIDGLPKEATEVWFADSYEFVELAVIESARGRGLGGALHDALLEGIERKTSVLSTQCGNAAALALYRARGWTTISGDFRFPNRPYPYAVMGLVLNDRGRLRSSRE